VIGGGKERDEEVEKIGIKRKKKYYE